MADTILTIDQLNKLFQSLLMMMLGLDPTTWNAYSASPGTWVGTIPINPYNLVRVSWPVGGQPTWAVTDDVVFLRIIEDDDPINRSRDVKSSPVDDTTLNLATSVVQVNRVDLIFYGPNSYQNARSVKNQMFWQSTYDLLAQSGLYMIKPSVVPRRVPEFFAGQWWERVDLALRFNELVITNETINIGLQPVINTQIQ